jgi:natural product precursor
MRKIKLLKLTQINKAELEKREMNQLFGSGCCACGCNGPSSTGDNFQANYNSGYTSTAGGGKQCCCWDDLGFSDHL